MGLFDLRDPEHTVDDNPLRDGTAEEVFIYRQRCNRVREEIRRTLPVPYALTEFITIKFPAEADVENPSAPEGEVFASFVQTILEHGHPTRLLWAKVIEKPEVIKVLLDWPTPFSLTALHTSSHFQAATTALEVLTRCPLIIEAFDLHEEHEIGIFWTNTVGTSPYTAFYIFRFPAPIRDYELAVPVSTDTTATGNDIVVRPWEVHWTHIGHQCYLRHINIKRTTMAYLGTSWAGGWAAPLPLPLDSDDKSSSSSSASSLPHPPNAAADDRDGGDAFCGVIGYLHEGYLANEREMVETLPYAQGGFKDLRKLASDLEVWHVKFTTLANGWLGGVTRTGILGACR